jgi:hypothetical protein
MTQLILDDQLIPSEVLRPLQKWTTAQRLRDLRPGEQILDERVPEILLTLKQPTFVTIDQGFWDVRWCHPGYCIAYFALRDDQQRELPGLLRALFREEVFRTRVRRMGKVVRVSRISIDFWLFQKPDVQQVTWSRTPGRKYRG